MSNLWLNFIMVFFKTVVCIHSTFANIFVPYDSSELKKAEDGTFTVDLSDHACPTFYFEVETGKNLHASWTIRFSNVNNTYVKLLSTKDEYRTTRDLFFSMGLD